MINFDFNEDYILENEFVRLEPLSAKHYEDFLEFTIHEPEIWEYSMVKCDTPENLNKYIGIAIQKRINQEEYTFAVFDKKKQKFVGATRYCDIYLNSNRLQMGYTWYGKAFQGTGVNKNCKWLLLEFAFEKMQMVRVEFRAYSENLRSINALLSIGCSVDGVLRSNAICPKTGVRRDTMVLSILNTEWNESVREMLYAKIYPMDQ
ncbi:GNAT family N-acetyltransferase [Flavobacterium sp. CBA20B-1]|uniref:GNAT family N-acetyltransferase n=1 Tax=Paenimyroides aestuarii TaxID=2968490 RepID=A0ABY5NT41_9FLAO|nr:MULTISPECIES: GNAT family N-acetyltransferase [Flavobacteriaceae]UUV21649.1 GNAT family N-acetyltransferase [Paenimyroides aestuarii]WCM41882.1 GNAT family N-acetyltransferase [Flavobacterium sp. CBA20B-1]